MQTLPNTAAHPVMKVIDPSWFKFLNSGALNHMYGKSAILVKNGVCGNTWLYGQISILAAFMRERGIERVIWARGTFDGHTALNGILVACENNIFTHIRDLLPGVGPDQDYVRHLTTELRVPIDEVKRVKNELGNLPSFCVSFNFEGGIWVSTEILPAQ